MMSRGGFCPSWLLQLKSLLAFLFGISWHTKSFQWCSFLSYIELCSSPGQKSASFLLPYPILPRVSLSFSYFGQWCSFLSCIELCSSPAHKSASFLLPLYPILPRVSLFFLILVDEIYPLRTVQCLSCSNPGNARLSCRNCTPDNILAFSILGGLDFYNQLCFSPIFVSKTSVLIRPYLTANAIWLPFWPFLSRVVLGFYNQLCFNPIFVAKTSVLVCPIFHCRCYMTTRFICSVWFFRA